MANVYKKDGLIHLTKIEESDVINGVYKIPKEVAVIDAFAFSGVENLRVIKLHNHLKSIDMSAFENCYAKKIKNPVFTLNRIKFKKQIKALSNEEELNQNAEKLASLTDRMGENYLEDSIENENDEEFEAALNSIESKKVVYKQDRIITPEESQDGVQIEK